MIRTELIYGVYDISDDINSFIAKHAESNPTFRLIDIKYQAFGNGTNNYSTSHNALIIYEEETEAEKKRRHEVAIKRYRLVQEEGTE
jgi:hypothetical protein